MHKTVRLHQLVLVSMFTIIGVSAKAQGSADGKGVDSQLLWISPGPSSFVTVQSSDILGHKGVSFGAVLDYYRKPLGVRFKGSDNRERTEWVVSHAATADFSWAFGLADYFQLGLVLPVVMDQEGVGATPFKPVGVEESSYVLSGSAMKDIRLDLKTRFLGKAQEEGRDGFGLSLDVTGSIPAGDELNFAGENGWVFQPTIVVDFRNQRFSTALNIGARLRTEKAALADLEVGHQGMAGLGVTGFILDERMLLSAEGVLFAELNGFGRIGIEYRGAVGYIPDEERSLTLWLSAGSAAGTEDMLGTPLIRILFGINYAPQGI